MPWLALCTAVVTEIIWGLSLKWAPTTSRPLVAALIPIVLSFLNMGLLSYAMRFLPAGLSYALWTGLGSIGWPWAACSSFKTASPCPRPASCC